MNTWGTRTLNKPPPPSFIWPRYGVSSEPRCPQGSTRIGPGTSSKNGSPKESTEHPGALCSTLSRSQTTQDEATPPPLPMQAWAGVLFPRGWGKLTMEVSLFCVRDRGQAGHSSHVVMCPFVFRKREYSRTFYPEVRVKAPGSMPVCSQARVLQSWLVMS